MFSDSVQSLLSTPWDPTTPARPPFDPLAVDALAAWSGELRTATAHPDVQALAFWLRPAHLAQLQRDYARPDGAPALGRGTVFHVTPGNVALTFAYSLATSLLAGNRNVVKLSSRDFPEVTLAAAALDRTLTRPEFGELAPGQALVRYDAADPAATRYFSSLCDVRVLWGGDATINAIRAIPLPPRATEVTFADRFSLAALDAAAVLAAPAADLARAAAGFAADALQFDQAACSSPHLVVWTGAPATVAAARDRFWPPVYQAAARYPQPPVRAVDKLAQQMADALTHAGARAEPGPDNSLVRTWFPEFPADAESIRCPGGYFAETALPDLAALAPHVTPKCQTLAYFGYPQAELRAFVTTARPQGIDRIVPLGRALAFGPLWDGYDLWSALTRVIDLQ
ncbi:MAG: hypothetical protein LBR33_10535 [Propionibacteriaceae bacterium]|jgi:hypothetical protein|nr:hypothetical protein [Propionibacteriaceae bacterium]